MSLWTVLKNAVLEQVDSSLDRFAEWACMRHGKTLDARSIKQYDDGKHIIGYVIPDFHDGTAYITRIMSPLLPGGYRVFLHRIHRPDHDRDLHNHPWSWSCSFILRGSYDEERPVDCHHHDCGRTKTRRVRRFNWIRGTDLHRITQLHGDVWTLFIHGPRHGGGWGFREWDSGNESFQLTPSDEYIARKRIERQMSGVARYYDDPSHDLAIALGETLDAWGKILDCPRLVVDTDTESDVAYRDRLAQRIDATYNGWSS